MIRQRIFIAAVICGYLAWNLSFLVQGKVPSSIFKSLTGLPCPTSGGWRSFCALLQGDFRESFLYNPFTGVFLLLLLISVIFILQRLLCKKAVLLPSWLAIVWCVSLVLAWGAKFLLGPAYW